MTSFLRFQAFAAARGEGLLTELQTVLDQAATGVRPELTVREDGMLQSGPDPRSQTQYQRRNCFGFHRVSLLEYTITKRTKANFAPSGSEFVRER